MGAPIAITSLVALRDMWHDGIAAEAVNPEWCEIYL